MWVASLPRKDLVRDGASASVIQDAARTLAQGHLVAFPTETVYGLGADGLNPAAAARIFAAKGRPADHPVILHVADMALAKSLASEWPYAAEELAKTFWPGPLTLILKRAPHVPDIVTGGQDTVGVRIPSHPVALGLLSAFAAVGSGVIAAPSANRFGAVSPTRAADVVAGMGDRLSADDMVIDGGACDVGVESTIVDLSSGAARILRPGGVSRAAIARCLKENLLPSVADRATHANDAKASHHVTATSTETPVPRVSGSLASHYAPRARVILAEPCEMQALARDYAAQHPGHRWACLVRGTPAWPQQPAGMVVMPMPMDATDYAQVLYARLHDADRQGLDALLIEMPPEQDAWEAVRDRLKRAAA